MKSIYPNLQLFTMCMVTGVVLLTGNLFDLHAQIKKEKRKKEKEENTVSYIVLDYVADEDRTYKRIENFESSVGIKVVNVNKKLVTITSDVTSTSFNTDVPTAFKIFDGTTLPDKASAADEEAASFYKIPETLFTGIDLTKVNSSIRTQLNDFEERFSLIKAEIDKLDDAMSDYLSKYKYTKRAVHYHKEIEDLSKICNVPYNEIETNFRTVTKRWLQNDQSNLNNVLTGADLTSLNSASILETRGILTRYLDAVLEQVEKSYQNVLTHYTDASIANIQDQIDELKNEFEKLKIKIKAIKKPSNEETTVSDFDMPKWTRVLGRSLNKRVEFYKKAEVKKLNSNIEEFSSTGMNGLLRSFNSFNQSNYTFILPPVFLEEDQTNLKIRIVPKEEVPCVPETRSYDLRIRTKGGVKIDFSTGLFVNVGGPNFIDRSYSYAPDSDSVIVKLNKSGNSFFPSLGALAHIYPRNGRDIQLAGCFGVSTKNLDKVNFHIGVSLIFGQRQRFVLSSGVTMAKITLLDEQYNVGQRLLKAEAPDQIPTGDFNRFGGFISCTWNLTKK